MLYLLFGTNNNRCHDDTQERSWSHFNSTKPRRVVAEWQRHSRNDSSRWPHVDLRRRARSTARKTSNMPECLLDSHNCHFRCTGPAPCSWENNFAMNDRNLNAVFVVWQRSFNSGLLSCTNDYVYCNAQHTINSKNNCVQLIGSKRRDTFGCFNVLHWFSLVFIGFPWVSLCFLGFTKTGDSSKRSTPSRTRTESTGTTKKPTRRARRRRR